MNPLLAAIAGALKARPQGGVFGCVSLLGAFNYHLLQHTGYRLAIGTAEDNTFSRFTFVAMPPGSGWIQVRQ